MSAETARPMPHFAIVAWWQSMQDNNVDAIERMALDDYVASGGPGPRTLGKHEFLEGVRHFLAAAVLEDWSVSDLEVREHGDVAVCSYLWSERGFHGGEGFDLGGATDVLLFEGAVGANRRTT